MSSQIVVTLSDDSLRQAEVLAKYGSQDLSEVLSSTLEQALRPLQLEMPDRGLEEMSDSEVLAWADGTMAVEQADRMSELLNFQQAGRLNTAHSAELAGLVELYSAGTYRKALAIAEAIRRGLRPRAVE